MKTTNKIFSLACASALFASPVFADNNDSVNVNVTGQVVASLEITLVNHLTMPDVVLPDDNGEETFVNLICSNEGVETVVYDALGGNPFAHGIAAGTNVHGSSQNIGVTNVNFTGICAELTVTGEADFNFTIAANPNAAATYPDGITLSDPTCISNARSLATVGQIKLGSDTLYCGATITVDKLASVASYSITDAVIVTVVYD